MIGLKSTLNVTYHESIFVYRPKLNQKKKVVDNSGALLVECVNVLKNKVNNGWGGVGDEIVCIVKRARPISSGPGTGSGAGTQAVSNALKVRRGDVRRAVIVRCRKSVRRPDGRLVRFDDNAAVLLNNKREMLGTRIGGVVSADLRMKGWGKIVSLAPKVSNDYPQTPVAILGKWVVKAVGC
jgi:ribosomal protein L14